MRGHGAVEGAGGQVAQSLDLVAGDAGGAERLVRSVEQKLRRGVAAEVLAHAAVNGGRGLAVQLLVEDRFEQRLEGRGRVVEAERERAGAIDERGEFGVAGAQVRHCLGGIEGKFAAAAVVNHGWSVSHETRRSGYAYLPLVESPVLWSSIWKARNSWTALSASESCVTILTLAPRFVGM